MAKNHLTVIKTVSEAIDLRAFAIKEVADVH